MDLKVSAQNVEISAYGFRQVNVELLDVDKDDVLHNFKLDEVIDYLGSDKVLDYIGEKVCKEYFHLTDK